MRQTMTHASRTIGFLATFGAFAGVGMSCATAPDSSSDIPAGLSAHLEAPLSVTFGDSMPMTIVLENASDDSISFITGEGDEFDPAVDSLNGDEVWSKAGNVIMGGVGITIAVPAHGEVTFRATWSLKNYAGTPLPPGQYIVRARVPIPQHDTLFADNSPFRFAIVAR